MPDVLHRHGSQETVPQDQSDKILFQRKLYRDRIFAPKIHIGKVLDRWFAVEQIVLDQHQFAISNSLPFLWN